MVACNFKINIPIRCPWKTDKVVIGWDIDEWRENITRLKVEVGRAKLGEPNLKLTYLGNLL